MLGFQQWQLPSCSVQSLKWPFLVSNCLHSELWVRALWRSIMCSLPPPRSLWRRKSFPVCLWWLYFTRQNLATHHTQHQGRLVSSIELCSQEGEEFVMSGSLISPAFLLTKWKKKSSLILILFISCVLVSADITETCSWIGPDNSTVCLPQLHCRFPKTSPRWLLLHLCGICSTPSTS